MSSNWMSTPNASNRVKELLSQTGVPLEMRVGEICSMFVDDLRSRENSDFPQISSQKLVYSSSEELYKYRKIDRLVDISNYTGSGQIAIYLSVEVPIECKYRKDLEIFAFPSYEEQVHYRFPTATQMRRSRLFQMIPKANEIMGLVKPSILSLVEITKGESPQKVSDENLIYDSADALYEFIYEYITSYANMDTIFYDEVFENTMVFDLMDKEIVSTNDVIGFSVRVADWVDKLPHDVVSDFKREYLSRKGFFHFSIYNYLPVVCLDSPIYQVYLNDSFEIKGFKETQNCVATIVKKGWPGDAVDALYSTRPEVPVIITNPGNLRGVLDLSYVWFERLSSIFVGKSDELILRYVIEANISEYLRKKYEIGGNVLKYRSDNHRDDR